MGGRCDFFYSGCLPESDFTNTISPFAVDQITGPPGNYGIFTPQPAPHQSQLLHRVARLPLQWGQDCLANSDANYEVVFHEGVLNSFDIIYGAFGSANATVGAIGVEQDQRHLHPVAVQCRRAGRDDADLYPGSLRLAYAHADTNWDALHRLLPGARRVCRLRRSPKPICEPACWPNLALSLQTCSMPLAGTPTLAKLQRYPRRQCRLSPTADTQDATTLGNNLDAYISGGGIVVAANFDWFGPGTSIGGAWMTNDSPFNDFAPLNLGTGTLQTCTFAPLCDGVTTLQSFFRSTVTLASGGTQGWHMERRLDHDGLQGTDGGHQSVTSATPPTTTVASYPGSSPMQDATSARNNVERPHQHQQRRLHVHRQTSGC